MSDLTQKQQRFVEEYLVDLNATQAAIRSGYSQTTAGQQGFELLKKPEIAAAIKVAMDDRASRTEITQDKVLRRWWDIATADVNDLIQYRRTSCRHCHGIDHAYPWVDESEYERAVARVLAEAKEDETPILPTNEGGYGFDSKADPDDGCPKCRGEGIGEVFAADTRKLRGGARMLFDGVKQTKDGFEIKVQSREKALEQVARHLGMFKDKVELSGPNGGPMQITRIELVPLTRDDDADQTPA